jgi:hypothetical protein
LSGCTICTNPLCKLGAKLGTDTPMRMS